MEGLQGVVVDAVWGPQMMGRIVKDHVNLEMPNLMHT